MLGIYVGDDGLTANLSPAKLEQAARWCGQEVESIPRLRPADTVSFVARTYGPGVWTGDPNSICDVKRQLSKFHVSKVLPSTVTPEDKAIEKARSFFLSDRKTPLVGGLAIKILTAYDEDGFDFDPLENPHGLRSWMSLVSAEEQYPNEVGAWAEQVVREQMPEFDFDLFHSWLRDPDFSIDTTPCCLRSRAESASVTVLPAVECEPSTSVPEPLTSVTITAEHPDQTPVTDKGSHARAQPAANVSGPPANAQIVQEGPPLKRRGRAEQMRWQRAARGAARARK